MSARASLISIQDQRDNNILVGSNLYLTDKLFDKNSFEKVFSLYDWHWEFNYYDSAFMAPNYTFTSSLYDQIIRNNKPLNLEPFYVHSQTLNLTTDIMPRWDLTTRTIIYDIYNGYSKGIYPDTTAYSIERSSTVPDSHNTVEHTLPSYNENKVILHMRGNAHFNEDVYFTASSKYYNVVSSSFSLDKSLGSSTYDVVQSTYTSFKHIFSINENIVSINNDDTNSNDNVKAFGFKKGWNKLDIIVLLDLTINNSASFPNNSALNSYLRARKFFSLGWNPTIKNFNPNVLINGSTALTNNAPSDKTIYMNHTDINDSIALRYIPYFSCTFPNMTSFPTNRLMVNNVDTDLSYQIKQSGMTATDNVVNYPIITYLKLPTFNSVNNATITLNLQPDITSYSYYLDTVMIYNLSASDLNFNLSLKFFDIANTNILTITLSNSLKPASTPDSSYMFHDLNHQIPNTATSMSYDIINNLTNTSIKLTNNYSFNVNVVQLHNNVKNTAVPSLDFMNDYSPDSITKIMYDGSVGIGTTDTQTYSLFVNNITNYKKGIYCTDDITILSDIHHKDNICPIHSPLEKIRQLRGVTYNRTDRDDDKPHMGLIAQEVSRVVPEVVDGDGRGVQYANLVALLIEGIKELDSRLSNAV